MSKINILDNYLFEWVELLNAGKVTSVQIVESCLDRIEKFDDKIKSFTKVFRDQSISESIKSDARRSEGNQLSLFDGIPYASKENIEIKNEVAAAGMVSRKDIISENNANVIEKLDSAGAICIGHLNMHEAALGSTNENPLHGKTFNPHRLGFTPGGSSGGSAAAVASGFCLFSLGTDTLGSIRIPAAYCGVSGIKPTKGIISLNGIIPLSSSFDTVGPLSRNVKDLSLILDIISGFDPNCSESIRVSLERNKKLNIRDIKIGYFDDLNHLKLDAEIGEKYRTSLKQLSDLGFVLEPLSDRNIDFSKARRSGFKIVEAEAYVHHQKDIDERPDLLSDSLRKFLEYGRGLSAVDLIRSMNFIKDLKVEFNNFFNNVDAILIPTTLQKPFEFGKNDKTQADLTCVANLIESPAVSIPVGFSEDGLPIGLQFVGKKFDDLKILEIAEYFDEETKYDMNVKSLS